MCNNCGNIGYTIELNAEGVEYMEGCFECYVASHEADSDDLGAIIDRVMDMGLTVDGPNGTRPLGLVDIAKMPEDWLRRLAA